MTIILEKEKLFLINGMLYKSKITTIPIKK